MAETAVATPVKNDHNSRKNKKPLMEKRRRARINTCLSQLKALVLQAIKKDSSQFSKLEKADILELTVKHLRALQRQQVAGAMTSDPNVVSKYRAGFNECAKEVVRYLSSVRDVSGDVKERVVGHLANCLQVVNHVTPVESLQQCMKPLHVHIPQPQTVTATPALSVLPPSNNFAAAASSLTLTPSPSDCSSTSSPLPQNLSPVSISSGLHLQHVSAVTTAPTTVLTHNSSQQISGAFRIVPSSACPSGAVALYLGNGNLHRGPCPDSKLSVDAVPLYSMSLPQSEGAVTAFVPSVVTSLSPLQHPVTQPTYSSVVDSRNCSKYSTISKMEYATSSYPVDLRHTSKLKAASFSDACVSIAGSHCNPPHLADEKLWRPW